MDPNSQDAGLASQALASSSKDQNKGKINLIVKPVDYMDVNIHTL